MTMRTTSKGKRLKAAKLKTSPTTGGGCEPLQSSETMGGSALTQYKEQQDAGERKENTKTREPKEIASEATGTIRDN